MRYEKHFPVQVTRIEQQPDCFGLKGRCRQANTGSGWIRQMSKILLETSSVEGLGLAEKSLSEARQGHEAMGLGVGSPGGDWRQTKLQI